MALTTEFSPVITNDLGIGLGVYGVCTPYNSLLPNNGALQPPGSLSFIPAPSMGSSTLPTAHGYCSGLWVKLVLYKSTANPAVVAGPAPVYYVDETFQTVSGVFSEGIASGTGSASSLAGFLLPNSGTVAGIGAGTAFTNTVLNNNGLGSWVYIGVAGFISSAFVNASGAAVNSPISGGTGNFSTVVTTGVVRLGGYVWSAVTSSIADIIATLPQF
jgi:hypothetical protein